MGQPIWSISPIGQKFSNDPIRGLQTMKEKDHYLPIALSNHEAGRRDANEADLFCRAAR